MQSLELEADELRLLRPRLMGGVAVVLARPAEYPRVGTDIAEVLPRARLLGRFEERDKNELAERWN